MEPYFKFKEVKDSYVLESFTLDEYDVKKFFSNSHTFVFMIGVNLFHVAVPSRYNGKPVIGIARSAFRNCRNVGSVSLPVSVSTIDTAAFSYCKSLKEVICKGKISFIGRGAFRNCDALESVIFNNGVDFIKSQAFKDCHNLSYVDISSASDVEKEAFNGCKKLEEYFNVPNFDEFFTDTKPKMYRFRDNYIFIQEGIGITCVSLPGNSRVTIPSKINGKRVQALRLSKDSYERCFNNLTKILMSKSIVNESDLDELIVWL